MKYVVRSQEKNKKFPIYVVHSNMDSFILYNAEIDPLTDVKVLTLKQEEISNQTFNIHIQEISEHSDTTC